MKQDLNSIKHELRGNAE